MQHSMPAFGLLNIPGHILRYEPNGQAGREGGIQPVILHALLPWGAAPPPLLLPSLRLTRIPPSPLPHFLQLDKQNTHRLVERDRFGQTALVFHRQKHPPLLFLHALLLLRKGWILPAVILIRPIHSTQDQHPTCYVVCNCLCQTRCFVLNLLLALHLFLLLLLFLV